MDLRIIFALLLFFSILSLFIASKTETTYSKILPVSSQQIKDKKDIENQFKNWHHKDIIDDSIPGISLDKAYNKLIKNKKGKPVIVAIVDLEVDIDHEDLKANIWKNPGEISGNNIDDDNNGYIDDIHGWNFLGNSKGENIIFSNYEYTRIIKKFDSVFKDKTLNDISPEQQKDFLTYKRAQKKYEERMEYALKEKQQANIQEKYYKEVTIALKDYFPNKNYTVKKLDSIKKLEGIDESLKYKVDFMLSSLKFNITEEWIIDYKLKAYERIDKLLNLEYNEREILGDNPEDITDINYGNNILNANKEILDHGTKVAGVLAASRADTTGAKGISDNIRIMPLRISPYGNEHDKDIALAIRYAVNNGAKVINMSFGKEFSLHRDWVTDAMKYAEDHNVLIVKSAGNDEHNLDRAGIYDYPNDADECGTEQVENFIKVGNSTYLSNGKFRRSKSNYGKKSVDIFAPGEEIYSTAPKENKKYGYFSGTSYSSSIVAGIAALIWSYYPKLSAVQVKDIILQSGVTYNIDVEIKEEDDTKKTIPFPELSKSGKVVNAYNALLMAERIAKKK